MCPYIQKRYEQKYSVCIKVYYVLRWMNGLSIFCAYIKPYIKKTDNQKVTQ